MASSKDVSGGNFTTKQHASTYDYISPLKLDLTGKHVLVTGVAYPDGVGYATATAFARAGASAIVVVDIHDISSDSITRLKTAAAEAGRRELLVLPCKVDVADLGGVEAMRERLSQPLDGRLDILVNNAAFMEPYKVFLDSDPEVYWRTYDVNIRGLFNMARTFLPLLFSTRSDLGGLCTMINVAPSGALTARAGSSSYRSSELAILRWTESMVLEYGDQGLVAISVNPGAIKTMITKGAPENVRNKLPHQPDIAGDTIVWLAAERREWLAGRYVSCPWDMEELVAKKEEIVEGDKLKLKMTF